MPVIFTFGELTKKKPVSVSIEKARYAIEGTYKNGAGVLCLCSNKTDAEAGKIWYEKRGGVVKVVRVNE